MPEIYYGKIKSGNPALLTLVKVFHGNVIERRSIQLSLWVDFLDHKDFYLAVHNIRHSTLYWYKKEDIIETIPAEEFETYYQKALSAF